MEFLSKLTSFLEKNLFFKQEFKKPKEIPANYGYLEDIFNEIQLKIADFTTEKRPSILYENALRMAYTQSYILLKNYALDKPIEDKAHEKILENAIYPYKRKPNFKDDLTDYTKNFKCSTNGYIQQVSEIVKAIGNKEKVI
jgi:hypothetical protein